MNRPNGHEMKEYKETLVVIVYNFFFFAPLLLSLKRNEEGRTKMRWKYYLLAWPLGLGSAHSGWL